MRNLLDIVEDFIEIKITLDSPRGIGWDEVRELREEREKLDKEVEEWLSTNLSNLKPSN